MGLIIRSLVSVCVYAIATAVAMKICTRTLD